MIYRVRCKDTGSIFDEHQGYYYFGNRKEAKKEAKEWSDSTIESRPVPKNKTELLKMLNSWGGHPDNG